MTLGELFVKTKFDSHFELRNYFNKIRTKATVGDFSELLKIAKNMLGGYVSDLQKEAVEDLIIEIENDLDILKSTSDSSSKDMSLVKRTICVLSPSLDVEIIIFNEKPNNLLRELEKEAIRISLIKFKGNRVKSAGFLGISIRTLRNKINEYMSTGEIHEIELPRICE